MSAKIVGIYPIEFSDEWFQRYVIDVVEFSYADEEERAEEIADEAERHRDTMKNLHVIEIEADRPITSSDMGLFTQDEVKKFDSQVPYMEVWIDDAGRPIPSGYDADYKETPKTNRVAFYLHFVEPQNPLYGPWGKMELPSPSKLPERLRALLAYEYPT